jgi:hypothetical protein
MNKTGVGDFLKAIITQIACLLFRRHTIREDALVEFKKNLTKPYPTKCKTCEHPLLAQLHPEDSKSYILVET